MAESFETKVAREFFYEQMERYRNLNDSLDLPAAVIPLYFLAVLFFADQLSTSWPREWHLDRSCVAYVGFLCASFALTVLIAFATYLYCRTIWHYQDATVLSAPREMEAWLRAESARLPADGTDDLETVLDRAFSEDYFTAAQDTFEQNERRSRQMFFCRRLLVLALLCTALAMVCYYLSRHLSR